MPSLSFFASDRTCPTCGVDTLRMRTPWYLRPLRWVLPHSTSTRVCTMCGRKEFRIFSRPVVHRHV